MDCNEIVVLGTGGTIAGTSGDPADNVGYKSAQLGVERLVARIPALAGIELSTEQVAQVDSKDMGPGIWLALAESCARWLAKPGVRAVVVTHGTDTIEETAWFLHLTAATSKPIVLTCAMRPATALAPDGPQNLLDAVTVARTDGAAGVVVVCAGVVHDAAHVTKVHPYRLDAFSSGEAGPVGYVEEGVFRPVRGWLPAAPEGVQWPGAARWPRVEIVMSHAGANGATVRALVADGTEGIVVAGTGNGSVHQSLLEALLEAQAKGVRVVRATRCAEGAIVRHAGEQLPASGLSAVKERITLAAEIVSSRVRRAPGK